VADYSDPVKRRPSLQVHINSAPDLRSGITIGGSLGGKVAS